MSDEKNVQQNEKTKNAGANVSQKAEPAADSAKDARIAELEAQLAAAQAQAAATKPAGPAQRERVPLTKENAGQPVKCRVKHGTFVGATQDGKVFDHEGPATDKTDPFTLQRTFAYRMADAGVLELV